jgi:hypothetical protein
MVSQTEIKPQIRRSMRGSAVTQQQQVENVKKDKIIEIIKEVPKPYYTYVDVPVDVYVDVPIERVYEREKIVETVIERPVEKVVEIPVEQIIEIPVERIIEVPVERKIKRDKEVDVYVEKPYDVIKENLIVNEQTIDISESEIKNYPNARVLDTQVDYVHQDKIIEHIVYIDRIVEKPIRIERQKIIELPKEKIITKSVARNVERIVNVDKIIEKEIEIPIEVPVYK